MGDALDRLSGTRLETTIRTDDKREIRGFGLIDSWRVIENDKTNRMVAVEVTLPDWLFRAVKAKEVLSINPDYFRLRKPLDRRIYELARKHCGHQAMWKTSIELLHKESGSTGSIHKFREALKGLSDRNELPDYQVHYDAKEKIVTFYSRQAKAAHTKLKRITSE